MLEHHLEAVSKIVVGTRLGSRTDECMAAAYRRVGDNRDRKGKSSEGIVA